MEARIALAKSIAEELRSRPENQSVDSPWYCIAVYPPSSLSHRLDMLLRFKQLWTGRSTSLSGCNRRALYRRGATYSSKNQGIPFEMLLPFRNSSNAECVLSLVGSHSQQRVRRPRKPKRECQKSIRYNRKRNETVQKHLP
jgi:hypothetical protein